ncbi:MAG: hypothetical protein II501_05210 [Clostridia bacterium]|nr:hypothetical protein [Clostridia bacterium]
MKKKIAVAIISVFLSLSVFGCGNGKKVSSSSSGSGENSSQTTVSQTVESSSDESQATQAASENVTENKLFDVTEAYKNKPYTDEFALERINELQYINDYSLCRLGSSEPSPIFYESFYKEKGNFNIDMQTYSYNSDNESVRKYFDNYEYSKLASAGAIRVIDSFAYNDEPSGRILYYCYYTVTHWSENESDDTLDYYRDLITVNKKDNSITMQGNIAIRTGLEIPKEVSGTHDFHNVI